MQCVACYHMNQAEINRHFGKSISTIKSISLEHYSEYLQRQSDFDKYGEFKTIKSTELGDIIICPKCGVIRKIL